jgi:hypothetical protein
MSPNVELAHRTIPSFQNMLRALMRNFILLVAMTGAISCSLNSLYAQTNRQPTKPAKPGARFVFADTDPDGSVRGSSPRNFWVQNQENGLQDVNPNGEQPSSSDELSRAGEIQADEDQFGEDQSDQVLKEDKAAPPQLEEVSVRKHLRPISQVTIDTQAAPPSRGSTIDVPETLPAQSMDYTMGERFWSPSTYYWQVPDTCRRPLYFEDRCLERCGCNRGYWFQPSVSAVKFVWDTAVWPVRMYRLHPRTSIYAQCERYNGGYCW